MTTDDDDVYTPIDLGPHERTTKPGAIGIIGTCMAIGPLAAALLGTFVVLFVAGIIFVIGGSEAIGEAKVWFETVLPNESFGRLFTLGALVSVVGIILVGIDGFRSGSW